MEYELVERLRGDDDDEDSPIIEDHRALKHQSSVSPEDYPDRKDRALHIPEENEESGDMERSAS